MSRCKVFPFWIVFNEEPEELIFVEHKVSFNVKSTTFVFWEAAEAGNIRMGKHREWCVTFEIQGNLWDHCMGKSLSFLYMNLRNTRKSLRSLYGKKLIVSVYETYKIQGNLSDHCMGKSLSFLYMKPTKMKGFQEKTALIPYSLLWCTGLCMAVLWLVV